MFYQKMLLMKIAFKTGVHIFYCVKKLKEEIVISIFLYRASIRAYPYNEIFVAATISVLFYGIRHCALIELLLIFHDSKNTLEPNNNAALVVNTNSSLNAI